MSGLKPSGGGVLNGIAFDSTTQSLWVTGKYWSNMYNVTFIEPEPEPEPVINPEPDGVILDNPNALNPIYSNIILVLVVATVVILLAMNLKDGGRNPTDRGPQE